MSDPYNSPSTFPAPPAYGSAPAAPAAMTYGGNAVGYGSAPAPGSLAYASLGRRAGARIIDSVLAVALFVIAFNSVVNHVMEDPYSESNIFNFVLALALLGLFYVLNGLVLPAVKGQSLGKMLFSIRIVRVAAPMEPLGWGAAVVRAATIFLAGLVPFGTVIDYLMGVVDSPEYRCVHDRAAGTRVVNA